MSTSTETVARTIQQTGAQLAVLAGARTRKELEQKTGLSRPTLIAAERGEDIQLSTLLRILDAHGRLPQFQAFVRSLCLSPE